MAQASLLQRTKIPVWRTVAAGYGAVFRQLPALLRAECVLIGIALVVMFAINWSTWDALANIATIQEGSEPVIDGIDEVSWTGSILEWMTWFVPIILVLPAVVRLHRSMISGVPIRAQSGREVVSSALKVTVAYLWLLFPIIALILILEQMDLFLDDTQDGTFSAVIGFATFAVVLAWLILYPRAAIRVAAVAIGRDDIGWGESWQASRGSTLRLSICFLLLIMPISITLIIAFWSGEPTGQLGSALYGVADSATTMLVMLFETALLSLAYLHFFGTDEPATTLPDSQ